MKIIKPQSLCALYKPYSYLGHHYLAIAALGFFRLGADNSRFLSESQQWPHVVASLPKGQPLDEVMPKHGAEVLLLGSVYAPKQQACTSLMVQMRVDDAAGQPNISKCLCVCGEREWQSSLLRTRRVGKPKPFVSMPLSYRRAFGGVRSPVNPEGCGSRGLLSGQNHGAMPNIAYPANLADDVWRANVAAGFGPIAIGNSVRRRKFGTYGRAWRKNDAPGFARNIDWSVFNMAPPDQWTQEVFQGGERYALHNLHPRHAELAGKLPNLAARAFVLGAKQLPDQAREVALRMDTVWFIPEHDLGIVIYHGQTEIDDSDGLDIDVLMVGYENKNLPKSDTHYRHVMALRLDRETALLHVFNDSQLAAERSPADLEQRAQQQKEAEEAALARSQRRIDLLDAQYWTACGKAPPADHCTARATLPVLGLMTSQTAAEGDFDLSEIVGKAKALAADAERRGKEALAKIPPTQATVKDPKQLLASALERAAVPAYDLLPPEETGRDPLLEKMLALLPSPNSDADPLQIEQNEARRAAVAKIPSLRRQARRAAPKVCLPMLPYPGEVADQLGAQVRQWRDAGVSLVGRDLAGANLAGIDFSGMDLREAMFDGADLAGAKFAGANLQGAVLVGAQLGGADFSQTNLQHANLCASQGLDICFAGADLSHAQALGARWPRANLRAANLRRLLGLRLEMPAATLDQADAGKATLFDLSADDSSWREARLEKTVLLRASLRRCDFRQASLKKTVFNATNLQQSHWDYAKLDHVQGGGKTIWNGATMVGAVVRNCGFNGADLSHIDLKQARFLRCDFGQADMRSAQLDDGLFSHCAMYRSDLRMASARRTEFFQCLCRKTDFSGAQLLSANFAQCENTGAIQPDGKTEHARSQA